MSIRSVALLGLVALAAAFAAAGQGSATQTGCTRTITRADQVHAALAAASPGDTLCFSGGDLAGAALMMTSSGTPDAPIRLVSDGHTAVHEVQIIADYVLIQGFTIAGGGELLLSGTGIVAQKNMVRDTQRGGIVCASCIDSTIESNTVHHAAATGVSISGQRITVRANVVSATVAGVEGSAIGVRFFGTGHRVLSNTIQDISGNDDPAAPQVACFQTFDTGRPPTFDVVILGNACQNVDGPCLIAAGDESGNGDAPGDTRSITFTGNTCAVNGDQAVGLRQWPNVDLHKNRLLGFNLKRGIFISDRSTGCTVKDNTTPRDVPAVEIDDSSRPGFRDQDKNPF
ncbi:MAG: right-handed parallel beta-helix repeat-containing protein [Actinomycetota bacterium]|nr:right-handed parallel beta-helix repeat-containing protein [Actinomycetota bacterium]